MNQTFPVCRKGVALGMMAAILGVCGWGRVFLFWYFRLKPISQACLLPMGLTSENVAAAYGIPRDRQDAMAADSHLKARNMARHGKIPLFKSCSRTKSQNVTLKAVLGSEALEAQKNGWFDEEIAPVTIESKQKDPT